MCGIAGIIDHGRKPEALDGILTKMLQVQGHRGPDATGNYSDGALFLGHNRLSIIDLSEAANQPMHYQGLSIVFNGEIYNYLEVRQELQRLRHTFLTQSDTEVILHAYKEWGSACVDRFMGMWAMAIWDAENKSLFASRDRFGIKPFYYIESNGAFYFSSEIKTLKVTPVFKNDLNLNQVARGLQLGWMAYHDETYFNCISSLPAAHSLIWKDGKSRVIRYWDLDNVPKITGSFQEKRDRFEQLFRESIMLHLRSDVPVASCLSGGLDSSAIVSMVQDLNPGQPYKSFSIYYDGAGEVDERPFINEVISKYPAVDPVYFKPSDDEIRDEFSRALYHADVPAAGSSFISQYFLMKLIRKNGIKVVLDGQGADEYLAGYMHSFYRLAGGMFSKGALLKGLSTERAISERLGHGAGSSAAHLGKSVMAAFLSEQSLYSAEYKRYHPFLVDISSDKVPFQLKDHKGSRLDAFLYHLMFNTSLPSLLQYEDRNSMAFSIESRVPFLDHRLVEFCFGLNDEDKINGVTTKYIMREALRKVLPGSVYSRKDKKGFVTPGENKWLRGPLSFMLEKSPQDLPFIRKDLAAKLIGQYKAGDNSKATVVWRLAVLNEWINRN